MRKPNYDKFPVVPVRCEAASACEGWQAIGVRLRESLKASQAPAVIAVDCYPGLLDEEVLPALIAELKPDLVLETKNFFKPAEQINEMVGPYVGDDPVFGRITYLSLQEFFDSSRALPLFTGLTLVYGTGASLLAPQADLLVYADLARWEAQLRFRRNEISNLAVENRAERWSLQYKRAFFVDWRVCDRHKKRLIRRFDFLLDTNVPGKPKLATGEAYREGLRQTAQRPFRVTPFFDPGPWGGQWMKNYCDLDRSAVNFAWCFDCVPEENSLHMNFGGVVVESPSINLVFFQPRQLLGDPVHGRFGDEFPIRFDFLDTMGGGNLSFQVHPLTEYIQEKFGMAYTQDESYYMLDAEPGAAVYLGLKEGIDPQAMEADLRAAQEGAQPFPEGDYVNRFPAQKHDHFLIPAGTVHCSGAGSMVLEISATPYIFTFKMWDWGRLGLDGRPRPVHLDHGLANIQWDRTTQWVNDNLINQVSVLSEGDGWREERTGLHEREFIETRRHWFTSTVSHETGGGVNVLNLVQGEEAVVESPSGAFEPFVIHYAETFIIPAAVGAYTIRPHGAGVGQECATLKAFVRTSPAD